MARHHDADDVRLAIRAMITLWAARQPVGVPTYLGGVALEESILELIRQLGQDPEEAGDLS